MTKQERLERFNELTSTHSVRSMADLVIQLEEQCERAHRRMARSRVRRLELLERAVRRCMAEPDSIGDVRAALDSLEPESR